MIESNYINIGHIRAYYNDTSASSIVHSSMALVKRYATPVPIVKKFQGTVNAFNKPINHYLISEIRLSVKNRPTVTKHKKQSQRANDRLIELLDWLEDNWFDAYGKPFDEQEVRPTYKYVRKPKVNIKVTKEARQKAFTEKWNEMLKETA